MIIFSIRYLISDIYFEYTTKKFDTLTDNLPIRIYVNTTENTITFRTKTRFYLEFLVSQTIKLLASTKNKRTEDKSCENVPSLVIAEAVLVLCNIVNNDYQQDSRVLYTFLLNKSCGELLDISTKNFVFKKF